MKKAIYTLLLAALMLAACGHSQQTTPEQAADRVLAAYRLHGMLEQAESIITDALKANLPAAVNKNQLQQLRQAVGEAYAPDKLAKQISQDMADAARRAQKTKYLTEAADALETDLVQRMVDLDDAAATDEFADEFAVFLKQPVEEGADARMQTMQGLASNLRLAQLQIAFNVGMLRGMIKGRNAAAPEPYQMSQDNADKMIQQTREGLQEHLSEQIPVMLFFAYREVPDDQLAEYVVLQDREALRWVNQAMVAAIDHAFAAAAQRVPQRYRALVDGEST